MEHRRLVICFILIVASIFVSSCSTYGGYSFDSIDSEGVEQMEIRGKSYEIATSGNGIEYMAYAQPTYDGDEVQVSVGIANDTEQAIHFSDSSIELFKGNYETGEWESVGRWDADNYYQAVYRELKSRETAAAIASVFAVLDAAMGTTSRSTISTPYGNSYVTTTTYSPALTGLTALSASAHMDSLTSNNRLTLDDLESTLLYSSTIPAKSSYSGNVYIETDNKNPEYMLVLSLDDGTTRELIFSRSDRYEVLHPWSDQSRDRHSVTYSHSLGSDRMQLTYLYSRRSGVGMYTGLSLYNVFKNSGLSETAPGNYWSHTSDWDNFSFNIDPNPTDRWDYSSYYDGHVTLGEMTTSGLGIPVGINFKVFPNTWMLIGCDVIINIESCGKGTIKYKNPDGVVTDYPGEYWFEDHSDPADFGLQAGFNVITNFLDFNVIATYVFPDSFYFDVGAGVAF